MTWVGLCFLNSSSVAVRSLLKDRGCLIFFFSVRSNFISLNERQSSIFTSGVATSEKITFIVHECNKIRSYTDKIKFPVSYMVKNCSNSARFNAPAITTEIIFFLIPFASI